MMTMTTIATMSTWTAQDGWKIKAIARVKINWQTPQCRRLRRNLIRGKALLDRQICCSSSKWRLNLRSSRIRRRNSIFSINGGSSTMIWAKLLHLLKIQVRLNHLKSNYCPRQRRFHKANQTLLRLKKRTEETKRHQRLSRESRPWPLKISRNKRKHRAVRWTFSRSFTIRSYRNRPSVTFCEIWANSTSQLQIRRLMCRAGVMAETPKRPHSWNKKGSKKRVNRP